MEKRYKNFNLISSTNFNISFTIFSFTFIFFILILLGVWIWVIYPYSWCDYRDNSYYDFPETHYAEPQTDEESIAIGIKGDKIFCGIRDLDISNLREFFQEVIKNYRLKKPKILLKIDMDKDTNWGFIVDVLKEIKKSNIYSVVFITKGYAYYHDYIYFKARKKKRRF